MIAGPILDVMPQKKGVLKVSFINGNSVTLDMKPAFVTYRFGALSNADVFSSVDTDGGFIRWYKKGMVVAELGYSEIMKMVLGEFY